MASKFSISINEVVDLLGLQRNPRSGQGSSYYVSCPFCHEKDRYHMNINSDKDVYCCFKCGTSGNTLDLFGRYMFDEPCESGSSGNSRALFLKLCNALHIGKAEVTTKREKREEETNVSEILPGDDAHLNKAYTCLLDQFVLSEQHYQNLIKRGLDDKTIRENGYKSSYSDFSEVRNHPLYQAELARYNRAQLELVRQNDPILKRYSKDQLIAGMIAAYVIRRQGVAIDHVPGFFMIGKYWFFKLDSGMFIPTRNYEGEIVSLQMRKDEGSLRYMTVSSKGLPEGPTAGIARPSFPLHNCPIIRDGGVKVIFTEGPLKADVALHLLQKKGDDKIAFIALQGVNNRNDLQDIFHAIRKVGIKVVFNGFDMDRLLNPSVLKACGSIRDIAREEDVEIHQLFWDLPGCDRKLKELERLAKLNAVEIPQIENHFVRLASLGKRLNEKGIRHSVYERKGKTEKIYWNPKTKGIDDFLLNSTF